MLFAYRDATLHEGCSKDLGTGGEASPRLFDLDGDNALDTVLADSSGELRVLHARRHAAVRASTTASRCARACTRTCTPARSPTASVDPPREVLRTPAIGDIDGDLEPEIVDSPASTCTPGRPTARPCPGFPVRLDPALSRPADRTRNNHIKRGFTASPALGDLDEDGDLEIVVPALDQHVYAWDGSGNPLPGFPKKLRDPAIPGAEIITTAALGDVNGDGKHRHRHAHPGVRRQPVRARRRPAAARPAASRTSSRTSSRTCSAAAAACTRSTATATCCPGWPTAPNGIVPDALPFVGPGVDHVLANVDTDPELEAIGNVASGDVTATNGNGSNAAQYDSEPAGGEHVDKSKVINLFENPIAANIDGVGGPGDHQGRRDAEPGREPRRGGRPEPALQPRRAGLERRRPARRCRPSRRRSRTSSCCPARWSRTCPTRPATRSWSAPASTTCATSTWPGIEGTGWPKFTGGWIFATPAVGRRGRRRRPRGDDAHARGLRLHVGHRPARLRHQRRVVDLAPRRVEHRRLRHRHAPARHARRQLGANPIGSHDRR